MKRKLPADLQGVLWSRDVRKIDLVKDKTYIIHQVLAHGGWKHLVWLFKTYGKAEIRRVFINRPAKIYRPQSFNFAARVLFGLPGGGKMAQSYDQTLPRRIG